MVQMDDVSGHGTSQAFMWSINSPATMALQVPAGLAKELQQNVTAFWAGDELHAAKWLTEFQRAEGAWEICIEALRPGPLPSCDEELVQEFCAQTLARLARSFASRHHLSVQHAQRDLLAALLEQHVAGQRTVWKQLALALTCAYLWTGTWVPPSRGYGELPEQVRRELLTLPVDLLFCDRALPLDDPRLRQAAAVALLEACGTAFEELLLADGDDAACLASVGGWLGALRRALRLMPACDATKPLQALAGHGVLLLSRAHAKPAESAEIALQLARWQQLVCNDDLATMLGPILSSIFDGAAPDDCQALLPLLADLSAGCWPRAALGDFAVDWQGLAESAMAILRIAVGSCVSEGNEDSSTEVADAEAAFAVWGRFAVTVQEGTQAAAATLDNMLEEDDDSGRIRPEKRSRMREEKNWRASPEQIAQCEALPQLFVGFSAVLLEMMKMPLDPIDIEALRVLWKLRAAAEAALGAWARLLGKTQNWMEIAFAPLQQVCLVVSALGEDDFLGDEVWRDVEVALWLSACLARSARSEDNAAQAPASAVLELQIAMDLAPEPWKTWVCAAASSLAGSAVGDLCTRLIVWMLERPPSASFAPEYMELTELPYAESLAQLCSQLPAGSAHIALGERLATLAFAERPSVAMHEQTVKAQSFMLRAMRHAMGGDAALLCNGLSQGVLPPLCKAVEAEAQSASHESEPQWFATRILFATLQAALPPVESPSMDPLHPALVLWKEHWSYVEAALMQWPQSPETEQPAVAAIEAITAAAQALPLCLPDVVSLLARSAAKHEMPDLELNALRAVSNGVRCPPMNAGQSADVVAGAISSAVEAELAQQGELLESPSTLAAFFQLLSDAVRPSPLGTAGVGPCADHLRPKMLERCALMGRCLALVPLGLQDCTSESATASMLRFMGNLVGNEEKLPKNAPHRAFLVAMLPELCASLCHALATLQHLTALDEGLVAAAELLLRLANALPEELPAALSAGIGQSHVSAWSGGQLQRHIGNRASYPKQTDWLEEFQQIVCELQREHRKVSH